MPHVTSGRTTSGCVKVEQTICAYESRSNQCDEHVVRVPSDSHVRLCGCVDRNCTGHHVISFVCEVGTEPVPEYTVNGDGSTSTAAP